MRARQVLKILYELFWVLLALFPILFWLFGLSGGIEPQSIEAGFNSIFVLQGGYIRELLSWLFDYTGLGFDLGATVWLFVDYFVTVEILHFLVDVFLWVFRFARKILDSWGVKE